MRKLFKFSLVILLLTLPSMAFAAPASPQETMKTLLRELSAKAQSPNKNSDIKALALKLAANIDEKELKGRLFSDLPQKLSPEEENNLLALVEEQFTVSLINLLEKKENNKDLPMKESVKDGTFLLSFTQIKDGKEQEITLLFALNGEKYLLKDVLVGKKSLLSVYQRQFKKLFKKHGYEEVVARLKQNQQASRE